MDCLCAPNALPREVLPCGARCGAFVRVACAAWHYAEKGQFSDGDGVCRGFVEQQCGAFGAHGAVFAGNGRQNAFGECLRDCDLWKRYTGGAVFDGRDALRGADDAAREGGDELRGRCFQGAYTVIRRLQKTPCGADGR